MIVGGPPKLGWLMRIILVLTLTVKAGLSNGANDRPLPAVSAQIAGPEVTVFRYATQACDEDDVPDAPARAIRVADDNVLLFSPHYCNRSFRPRPDLCPAELTRCLSRCR